MCITSVLTALCSTHWLSACCNSPLQGHECLEEALTYSSLVPSWAIVITEASVTTHGDPLVSQKSSPVYLLTVWTYTKQAWACILMRILVGNWTLFTWKAFLCETVHSYSWWLCHDRINLEEKLHWVLEYFKGREAVNCHRSLHLTCNVFPYTHGKEKIVMSQTGSQTSLIFTTHITAPNILINGQN